MNQKIDGDNNIQVGYVEGGLNIGHDDPLDPNNPNLIPCPSCSKLASRLAAPCPRCGYNILEHFVALDRAERRKRAMRVAGGCAIFAVVQIPLASASWLPEGVKNLFSIAALVALFVGVAAVSAMDRLK